MLRSAMLSACGGPKTHLASHGSTANAQQLCGLHRCPISVNQMRACALSPCAHGHTTTAVDINIAFTSRAVLLYGNKPKHACRCQSCIPLQQAQACAWPRAGQHSHRRHRWHYKLCSPAVLQFVSSSMHVVLCRAAQSLQTSMASTSWSPATTTSPCTGVLLATAVCLKWVFSATTGGPSQDTIKEQLFYCGDVAVCVNDYQRGKVPEATAMAVLD
eukprot:1138103-Pelagomonas_calceolata.AAC.5